MHVAVVGAGALGSVYGGRLAARAAVDVTFVVRTERPVPSPIVLERVDGDRALIRLDEPRFSTRIPKDADLILTCVSVHDLTALEPALDDSVAPIVVLTPLLPIDRDALAKAFGKRLFPAMPSVAAYRDDRGHIRYWLPRAAQTLVEEPRPLLPAIDAFVRALQEAGISARLQFGTAEINAATTVTFLPLAFALDVAGSVAALLADGALLKLALAAAHEGQTLGNALGTPAPWASLLVRFIGPTMLKIGIGLAERRSPEGVRYVEHHFGQKMHAQNVAMAEDIVALARERGLRYEALSALAQRLRARPEGR